MSCTLRLLPWLLLACVGCAAQAPASRAPTPMLPPPAGAPPEVLQVQRGLASWYGRAHHGRPTASGKPFDMYAMTAAHRTLRFGSLVRVERPEGGRRVVVTITDRGPFTRGRIIDLSYAAAAELGILRAGVAPVRLEVLRIGR